MSKEEVKNMLGSQVFKELNMFFTSSLDIPNFVSSEAILT
jgi:hypothetical protein